jgi:hypothetical protein
VAVKTTRTNVVGQRLCAIGTCSVIISPRFLMCVEHWHAVPLASRQRVNAAFSAWSKDKANADRIMNLRAAQAEAIALVS